MAAIVRSIYPKVKKQLLAKERFIQVLVGPRQVGKTTMVRQMVQEWPDPSMMVSADALPNAAAEWLITQWEAARLQAREATAEKPMLLVVDEIQKIDNWSEVVKKLWDEDAQTGIPLKAILLGSSRMLIQQGLTESLAGRFERTYLGHWTYAEMRDAFDFSLDQYIWFGGYPGSAQLIGDEERWRRYVNDALLETSISKDVLMLTQVSKPALMRRLFELGSYYSGKELSFTKLLGQLTDAGNTVTLSRYLELLDTAGLLSGLEKYSVNLVRQRSSSPKFQVHNNAMLTVMSNPDFNQWK
ncbi:MAG TPA: AAA family ATPase, partial [Catalimonadaceae bacterium]|nr:AAA family ATPase [Catalimonadaceae bacterium]